MHYWYLPTVSIVRRPPRVAGRPLPPRDPPRIAGLPLLDTEDVLVSAYMYDLNKYIIYILHSGL